MKFRFILFLILLSGLFENAGGQSFYSKVYDKDIYDIPTNLSKSIIIDYHGFVWIGSDNGLLKFDGENFTVFKEPDVPSLFIKNFYRFNDNRLYVITDGGIAELLDNSIDTEFKLVLPASPIPSDTTIIFPKSIFSMGEDELWISEPASVVKFKNGSIKRYPFPAHERSDHFFRSFQLFKMDSALFAFSQTGHLYVLNSETDSFEPISLKYPQGSFRVESILPFSKSEVLLGTNLGLYKIKRISNNQFTLSELNDLGRISTLSSIGHLLLAGTWNDGIYAINPIDNYSYKKISSVPFSTITQLYADEKSQSFWFSSDEGFGFLKPTEFSFLNLSDISLYIQDIIIDEKDRLLATEGVAVYELLKSPLSPTLIQQSFFYVGTGMIMSMTGSKDNLLIGHRDSKIIRLEKQTKRTDISLSKFGIENQIIQSIDLNPNGVAAFTISQTTGIGLLTPDNKVKILSDSVLMGYPFEVVKYINHPVYPGFYMGGQDPYHPLLRLEPDLKTLTPISVVSQTLKPGFIIHDIAISADHDIYLATSQGIWQLDNNTLIPYSHADYKTDINIKSIAIDANNRLWIGHEQGLTFINDSAFVNYLSNNGLPNLTSSYRCLVINQEGQIFSGTARGLAFSLQQVHSKLKTSPPLLVGMNINNKKQHPLFYNFNKIPGQSGIIFDFRSLTPPFNSVNYVLDIKSNGKQIRQDRTKSNSLILSKLDQGNYSISISAQQSGFFESDPLVLSFKVLPQWHETSWALIFTFLLLMLIILGWVRLQITIRDRQHAQELYLESLKRNEVILETIPDTLIRVNYQQKVLDIKTGTSHPGFIPDRLENLNELKKTLDINQYNRIYETLQDVRENKYRKDVEIQYVNDRVIYDFEARFIPISENEILIIFRDVSTKKQLERELIRASVSAKDASKMKSSFLATMSHEIRTPMNGVIGMINLLQNTKLDPEQDDYVKTIKSSSESLLELLNDILDLSKIEAGKIELEKREFNLYKLLESIVDLMTPKAIYKKIELMLYISPRVPEFFVGDEFRMKQVLVNLIDNAIKFTGKGFVEVKVSISEYMKKPSLVFSVRDTGIGIPREKLNRLFHSFSQVDSSTTRQYGGTGLGLAICERLVAMMKGNIFIKSKPLWGSEFRVAMAIPDDLVKQLSLLPAKKQGSLYIWSDHDQLMEKYKLGLAVHGYRSIQLFKLKAGKVTESPEEPLIVVFSNRISSERANGFLKSIIKQGPIIIVKPPPIQLADVPPSYSVVNKPVFFHKLSKRLFSLSDDIKIKTQEDIGYPYEAKIKPNLSSNYPAQILIAEDHPINAKLLIRVLNKMGYDPFTVTNGKEAVDALEFRSFDIIFMDVQMPVMDGFEATTAIKSKNRNPPKIIAITANAMQEDRQRCLDAGMDDYVSKPFKVSDVESILKKWIPTQSLFTE